ncbi:ABC transporter substrate-binding protein [Nocardioides sp. NBC_00850]|uniref:ABC transporter substrate-binding protein n=1 Tax=Nocardioides sp. NBC_00850 TaxID=2976001 RepID=UPI00386FCF56|nr:ABC transporter substrate-binding protein [Nocardioides sp. NBC_00850]
MNRSPARAARRGLATALVLAMPLALSACGGESADESAGGATEITVGVIPIVDVAPIYLGVEKGFFKEEGLDVNLELAQGGAAIIPAVASGQYQFGFSNTTLFGQLGEAAFWTDLGATLRGWATGLAIAMAAGIVLGVVIGSVGFLRDLTASTIEFLRPIPSVAQPGITRPRAR